MSLSLFCCHRDLSRWGIVLVLVGDDKIDCFDKTKCLLNADVNVMNVTCSVLTSPGPKNANLVCHCASISLLILFNSYSTSVYESFENGPL